MPLMSASAAVVADSTISANGQVYLLLSSQGGGSAAVSNPLGTLIVLVSGSGGGVATVLDSIAIVVSGTTSGHATVSSPSVSQHFFLSASTGGVASLSDSAPLPIHGVSTCSAFLQLVQIPLPVNCVPRPLGCPPEPDCRHSFNLFRYPPFPKPGEPTTCSGTSSCGCVGCGGDNPCVPKQFRWGQQFTFGNLMLVLRDHAGNPISPYAVTYTMYQVRGGVPIQAGPAGQRGVMQSVGVYYAVGTAGENGQPGNWLVRWVYRLSFDGVTTTADCPFTVVDSVLSPIPGDPTCRQQKYGWG